MKNLTLFQKIILLWLLMTIPVIVIHLINPWVADVISDAAKDWLGAVPWGLWLLLSIVVIMDSLREINKH